MGITLIVTRSYDESFNETGEKIHEADWVSYVELNSNLRFNLESIVAKNPVTGEVITMPAADGATEVLINGTWCPFFSLRRGQLKMGYQPDFESQNNPIRKEIVSVAKHFSALITTDAGDEILSW